MFSWHGLFTVYGGLKLYHGSVGRMLQNKKYLGDDYYPAIIDKETFDKAEEIRMYRAMALGRVRELKEKNIPVFFEKENIKLYLKYRYQNG